MKLRFKRQPYQDDAVAAVIDCLRGQPPSGPIAYRIDPGRRDDVQGSLFDALAGFKNPDLRIPLSEVLTNIRNVQQRQNLAEAASLIRTPITDINLDIEMETGTGKTYCYIKTIFELNKQYGWSKFIVVVPSIAIREGVHKSLTITAEHFIEQYGKRVRFFIYNSKHLQDLESFSSDAGINVMIINVQAFNARGQDARRIYEELDDFQSRRPIDVIARNRPILILDEPQKMEGAKTLDSLKEFNPLMLLRYSATFRQEHHKIYRLDALDAYNQKLVKKIGVRGIAVRGLAGTNPYIYLDSISVSPNKPPEAKVHLEIRYQSAIKREIRKISKGTDLFQRSDELQQYKGYVVADINAIDNTVSFTNGVVINAGEATGDVTEATMRRIQIREAVKAHFEKEQEMFPLGVKVLTLFFIDEVAKYKKYTDLGEEPGEYAQAFEEEYQLQLEEILSERSLFEAESPYYRYLQSIAPRRTHSGYFSIDKRTKRLTNPGTAARSTETDDVDAYDLILRDKERLLSFSEPVRFIFSHSALREGWDNPNVFVICTLKHSDSTISRRQEVGRGLRLAVNQQGDRLDDPATVHRFNVLTVVASESYKDFVSALQKDISASLSARPRTADANYFLGKVLRAETGDVRITQQMANTISRYLIKNGYVDDADRLTPAYTQAREAGTLVALPPELAPYTQQILNLVNCIATDANMPAIADERRAKTNPLNANFQKKEFQDLWSRINRRAAYTVQFDSAELITKAVAALNASLRVTPLQYTVQRGLQNQTIEYEQLRRGQGFTLEETATAQLTTSVHSAVKYDLIGEIAKPTQLTRATIGAILQKIEPAIFAQYRTNPEDFLRKAALLINEQKAAVIIEHLTYSPVDQTYGVELFTAVKPKDDFSKAFEAKRHVYDYVFTDSELERKFVQELDSGTDVEVYAKLPKNFFIPTPVGNYNPDWAIAFKQGAVKHVYFIAETKGSLSTLDLRNLEERKIACARRFFAKIASDNVKYDVVDSYERLMEIVK